MFENSTCIELIKDNVSDYNILDGFVDFVMSFFSLDNVIYIIFPLVLFIIGGLFMFVKRMAKGVF